MKTSGILSAGIAMFAMMFGAGNVIFPLALGRDVGGSIWYALVGFCLTAVVVPLIGIVSLSLYQGDYKKFLGTIGTIPGALIALLCMVLIGPFGCIPRCITISHAAVNWYFPQISLVLFSILAAPLVYLTTMRKNSVIDLLGRYLGPIKIVLLLSIVVGGLFGGMHTLSTGFSPGSAFARGLLEGYGTMDLLAAIFFAGLICSSLRGDPTQPMTTQELIIRCLKAGLVGGGLLGLMYIGFCIVAAFNASVIQGTDKAQLLSALASLVLGSWGGVLANITVAVSCFTTAIALTTVFADYVSRELTAGRLSYCYALLITTTITALMTNLGFSGIMSAISPIIIVCYPALIVLSIVNIAYKTVGFKYVKTPVFLTFLLFLCLQWL